MSHTHRKVLSHGNVPFSWEERPGVSKLGYRDSPLPLQPLNIQLHSSPLTTASHLHNHKEASDLHVDCLSVHNVNKIPPPPCRLQSRPSRNTSASASAKGFRWGEDPFLVAYKECTKSVKNGKLQRGSKGGGGFPGGKKSKFSFSCKSSNSCEVRDDSFFILPKPRRDRVHV